MSYDFLRRCRNKPISCIPRDEMCGLLLPPAKHRCQLTFTFDICKSIIIVFCCCLHSSFPELTRVFTQLLDFRFQMPPLPFVFMKCLTSCVLYLFNCECSHHLSGYFVIMPCVNKKIADLSSDYYDFKKKIVNNLNLPVECY